MRLRDALVVYGQWRAANFSPATWRGESAPLRGFVVALRGRGVERLGDTHLADAVAYWWHRLTLPNVEDSTAATRLAQVRSFLGYCRERGWLDGDPTSLIRAPKVAAEPRDRLTAAELLSLLDVARTPRDRCLLAIAMNLGLRGSEISRLTWADVNWPEQTIRVRVDKTAEVDDMPMSSDLSSELRRWVGWGFPSIPIGQDPGAAFVIPKQHHGPQGTTYTWDKPVKEPYEVVKRALRDIGWTNTTYEGVHTIRRSVARIYFDKVEAEESFDSALLATMTLLHHSRPGTTLTYIGRDRATMARDRILMGQPFLTGLVRRFENPSPLAALKAVAS